MNKHYSELIRFKSFEDRYEYLKLKGIVGQSTFGYDRYINQMLYTSTRWKKTRDLVIIRDNGNDLGIEDHQIHNKIIVHHMNPITIDDIEKNNSNVYDIDGLICTTLVTHNGIHYGTQLKINPIVERTKNDTCPWR